jgi:hypothetical protein
MRSRREFHPDLSECELEDRPLMAPVPGAMGTPFLSVNPTTNQIIVPGTSMGGRHGLGGRVQPRPLVLFNSTRDQFRWIEQ